MAAFRFESRSAGIARLMLAIAAVDKGERDLRCTRISRFDDFPKARREERSGAARAGQTVFTALVSINQSPAYRDLPGTVDHKSSNRADERPRRNYGTRSCDNERIPRTQ